ncbi:hypothetical protein ACFSC3_13870 [Sphingomonas floccifaciens]|uniref:Secreted protein n=1 Tax=Sphingomonas floccifaciens TaxID=1844115 RepID=A0ABW4NFF1_9SPHN
MLQIAFALALQLVPTSTKPLTTVGHRGPEYPYRKPISPVSRVAYWTALQAQCERRRKRACPMAAPDLVMVEADKPSDRDSDAGRKRR